MKSYNMQKSRKPKRKSRKRSRKCPYGIRKSDGKCKRKPGPKTTNRKSRKTTNRKPRNRFIKQKHGTCKYLGKDFKFPNNKNFKFSNNPDFYFVRHGKSCANIDKDTAELYHKMHPKYYKYKLKQGLHKDPVLSATGLQTSKRIGEKISKNQNLKDCMIVSSPLLRAIETAMYMFPGKEIHVYPYLKELGMSKDNALSDPSEQIRKILLNSNGTVKLVSVDFDDITYNLSNGTKINYSNVLENGYFKPEAYHSDIDKFKELLKDHDGCVIVVTHSTLLHKKFGRKDCKYKKNKPRNNQIIKANQDCKLCFKDPSDYCSKDACECGTIEIGDDSILTDEQIREQLEICSKKFLK